MRWGTRTPSYSHAPVRILPVSAYHRGRMNGTAANL
jgi:hypothetical protein